MPNYCTTNFVVECEDKQKLQRICDAIVKCNEMEEPLIEDSSKSWTGNIFKDLGLKFESDRCFWNDAYICDGELYILEESAWSRGSSMRQLVEQMNDPEDPDNDLIVYFKSEEPGCGIYETNDTDGVHYSERYILDTSEDGVIYYSNFEDLCGDVYGFFDTFYDWKSVDDIQESLDEMNDFIDDDDRWAYVHEFDTEVSL